MSDPLHILLVEDDEVDRMAVRRAWKTAGLEVELTEATDVASAVAALDRGVFDCAVIDHRLPDGSALDIVRNPSAHNHRPPVVILTGQGSESIAVQLMRAGVADYVPKSELTPSRIAQSIRNAIRVAQAEKLESQANDRSRVSENRFRQLFERSPDPILVEDLEGNVLDANPAAGRLHGIPTEELVGMNKSDLKPPGSPQQDSGLFAKMVTGELEHVEGTGWHREGRAVPVEIRVSRIDYGGQPALLLHLRDITDRRRSEAELQEAHVALEKRVQERTAELVATNRRLRTLASELSLAEERERRRIATGVHDEIGQKLALMKFKFRALQEAVTTDEHAEPFRDLGSILDNVIKDLRSLTFELGSPVLYRFGIEAAVEQLTEQIEQDHGIRATFQDDEQPKPLGNDVSVTVFQAVRELLFNVAKHATAKHVQVTIGRDGDMIRAEIKDDGVGFDTSAIDPEGGFGLFNIGERLQYIGGNVEIESGRGQGTKVTVVAPLSREDGVPGVGG